MRFLGRHLWLLVVLLVLAVAAADVEAGGDAAAEAAET
jgi:hypothetical protein